MSGSITGRTSGSQLSCMQSGRCSHRIRITGRSRRCVAHASPTPSPGRHSRPSFGSSSWPSLRRTLYGWPLPATLTSGNGRRLHGDWCHSFGGHLHGNAGHFTMSNRQLRGSIVVCGLVPFDSLTWLAPFCELGSMGRGRPESGLRVPRPALLLVVTGNVAAACRVIVVRVESATGQRRAPGRSVSRMDAAGWPNRPEPAPIVADRR